MVMQKELPTQTRGIHSDICTHNLTISPRHIQEIGWFRRNNGDVENITMSLWHWDVLFLYQKLGRDLDKFTQIVDDAYEECKDEYGFTYQRVLMAYLRNWYDFWYHTKYLKRPDLYEEIKNLSKKN